MNRTTYFSDSTAHKQRPQPQGSADLTKNRWPHAHTHLHPDTNTQFYTQTSLTHTHTHHSVTHTFLLSLQVYWYKAALCTAHSVLATMCTHSSAPRYKCTQISDKSRVPAHVPACVWSYESVVFIGITNTQQCWRYSFVMENTRFRSKPLPLDVVLMSDATAHKPLGII